MNFAHGNSGRRPTTGRPRRGGAGGSAQSAGGAAAAGGFLFQDRVGAFLAVHAVAGARAPPPWQLPSGVTLEHIASETGEHTDDWRLITSARGFIFVQVKRTISNSDSSESEIAKVWRQFIEQYFTGVGQPARQLDRQQDRIILVVGPETPATVRVHLRQALNRVRGLAPSDPLESAARNGDERMALTVALALIGHIWTGLTRSAPADGDLRAFLALVQVEELRLENGATDSAAIEAILRNAVLVNPDDGRGAWLTLCQKARELAAGRTGADRKALVEWLGDIHCQVRDPLESDIAGAAAKLIAGGPLPWRHDLNPPSALLDANYCIVPFRARLAERASLERWCTDERPILVRLYTGPGGMGKTRLLLDFIRHLHRTAPGGHWTAGFLATSVNPIDSAALYYLVTYPDRLFLVIDYAEMRQQELIAVLSRAAGTQPGRRVRVVLLARDALSWWRSARRNVERYEYLLQGPATIHEELAPFSLDVSERTDAFLEAVRALAMKLDLASEGIIPPDLSAAYYGNILMVHMAAYAAVHGQAINGDLALVDFLLDRECRFWDRCKPAGVSSAAFAEAAAIVTAAGGADGPETACRLIRGAQLMQGQLEETIREVAEALRGLYPGPRWLNPVQPDLAGERLFERVMDDRL